MNLDRIGAVGGCCLLACLALGRTPAAQAADSILHHNTKTAAPAYDQFDHGDTPRPEDTAETPTTAGAPATQPAKAHVPPAFEVARATKSLLELYKDDLNQASSSDEKSALAAKWLEAGISESHDMPAKYALLNQACLLWVASGDLTDAFSAIDAIGNAFIIDSARMKRETAVEGARSLHSADLLDTFSIQAATLADKEEAIDAYDSAKELEDVAANAARQAGDVVEARYLAYRQQRLSRVRAAYYELKPSLAVLKEKPSDPMANNRVGRFRCFVKADWAAGLPNLVRCGDEKLKAMAAQELQPDLDSHAQAALADKWWDMGEREFGPQKMVIESHAADLYLHALDDLTGLTRAKAKKRIDAATDALNREKGGPRATLAQIPRDAIQRGGRYFRIYTDACSWPEAKKKCEKLGGHLAKLKNMGDLEFAQHLSKVCWVGAADLSHKGKFVWLDGTPVDPQIWRQGEPSGRGEDVGSVEPGGMNDASQNSPANYLCEWDP